MYKQSLHELLKTFADDVDKNCLLSLNPPYYEAIRDGVKKYEFRKNRLRDDIDKVFIYVTSPIKLIKGYILIDKIFKGTPNEIWTLAKNEAGINVDKYFAYCADKQYIYAYRVHNYIPIGNIDPYEISSFTAPQSLTYF